MNKHIRVYGMYIMCTESCIKRDNCRPWGQLLNSMANSSRYARSGNLNVDKAKAVLFKMQHDCLNHVRGITLEH